MHPPHSWSSYKCPVRTNNDVEGWHHAINGVAKTNSMNMYLLISILHDLASRIPVIVKLLTQRKCIDTKGSILSPPQKKVKLNDLSMKHEEKSITTSEFLSLCAKLMDHAED